MKIFNDMSIKFIPKLYKVHFELIELYKLNNKVNKYAIIN